MNEFKDLPDYPKRYAKAVEVISGFCFVGQYFGFVVSDKTKFSALQQTNRILDLRNIADTVYKLHKDKMLTGPTGRTYCVTENTFLLGLCFLSSVLLVWTPGGSVPKVL